MLSRETIKEFQAIYKEHFGIELTEEEASIKGSQLLRLIEVVYPP